MKELEISPKDSKQSAIDYTESVPWNVAVVGLPTDTQESCYDTKPGKSFICNRYMRPEEDKQCNSHNSTLPVDVMKLSSVFNDDQFLYWGNREVDLKFTRNIQQTHMNNVQTNKEHKVNKENIENKENVVSLESTVIKQSINVLEFTHLSESSAYVNDTTKIYNEYLSYITRNIFCSHKKIAYLNYEQALNPNDYIKNQLYTGYHENQFSIDCYIVVISVEENLHFIGQQLNFLLSFYNRVHQKIIANQVTVVIAASKCDSVEYSETLDVLKDFLYKNQLDLPLIEVSSFFNVNVVNCFEVIVYLHYYRKTIMEMTNSEVFVSQLKLFDAIRNRSIDTWILPSISHKYSLKSTNSPDFYDDTDDTELITLNDLPKYMGNLDTFQVRFAKNCLLLNQNTQQFITIITKYAEQLAATNYTCNQFYQLIVKSSNNETDLKIFNDNISKFGKVKLAKIFQQVYTYKYTLIEKWIRQKYIETFVQALNCIFTDINSLSVCSWKWDKCLDYLPHIPNFNEFFVRNADSNAWNSVQRMNNYVYLFVLDYEAAIRLFKFKVPLDFLDIDECRVEFDRFLVELAEKNNQDAVGSQLEEQLLRMIDEKEFKACDAIEEVAYHLLFRGYDRLSQAIMEYEFTPIFTKYSEMLKEQAKRNFHELLFEHAIAIDVLLQGKFKMGSVRNLIQNDNRFKKLNGKLASARDGWIINHLASRDRTDICILNTADESACIKNASSVFLDTFPQFLVPFKMLPNQEFSRENSINIFLICSKSQFDSFYKVTMEHYGGNGSAKIEGSTTINHKLYYRNIMNWHEGVKPTNSDNNDKGSFDKFLSNTTSIPFRLIWFENNWANLKHTEQKFLPVSYTNFFIYFTQADNQSMLHDFINSFSNVIYQDLDANQLNFATKRIVNSVTIFQPTIRNFKDAEHSSLSRHDSLVPLLRNSVRDKRSCSSASKNVDVKILPPENKKFLSTVESLYQFKVEQISSPPEQCVSSILYTLIRSSDYITQYNLEVDNKINIAVCMMCGDGYPIEMIARMLIFNRKYFYFHETNTFRILYETNHQMKSTYYIDITFVPYHSTYKWSKIGGCISVCTNGRLASIEAMRALMHRNLGMPTHIMCILSKLRKSLSGVDCNVCQHTHLASKSAIQLLSDEGLSPTLFESFRKLNVFFELCCENNTQPSYSVSESIDDITASGSLASNLDAFHKDSTTSKSLVGSRLRKGRQTITPEATSCNSPIYNNSKVAWHKNPMYHPASANTISVTAGAKSRKWSVSRMKKGEKSVTTASLCEKPTDSTEYSTTKLHSYTGGNDRNEKMNSNIDLANTRSAITLKEHKQPERFNKMLRHQQPPHMAPTSERCGVGHRSGSLTASDFTSSETTPLDRFNSKDQNNELSLDIISSGYLNTLSLGPKSRSKILSNESATLRGYKRKNKLSDKSKISSQFNKMFNNIKSKASKKLPTSLTYNNQTPSPNNYSIDSKNMSVVDKIEQWSTIKIKKDLNIYNQGEPNEDRFIGKPLSEVCDIVSGTAKFMEKVIAYIESTGLQTEGLYRISGRKFNIDQLISSYNQDNNIDFNSLDYNVHVFTSCLKSFIKSLPTPLFPQNLFDQLLNKPMENNEIPMESIRNMCSNLDRFAFETFKFLMRHLHNVSKFSSTNQMMPTNLSLCWWPTIVRPAVESITKINQDGAVFTAFFTTLIGNYFDIFPQTTPV